MLNSQELRQIELAFKSYFETEDISHIPLWEKLTRAAKHPQPFITADIILWRFVPGWGEGKVELKKDESPTEILLIQRAKDPHVDRWALPGGHFDIEADESILEAAYRELEEETNVKRTDLDDGALSFQRYYDQKKRDTRGRYVDFVFSGCMLSTGVVKAADDAKNHQWFNSRKILHQELAFDHHRILSDYLR